MKIRHAKILSIAALLTLCFCLFLSLHIYITVNEKKHQLEEIQLAQRALYFQKMELRTNDSIQGSEIFKANCTQCHRRPRQKHSNLDRIFERRSTEYFDKFVLKEDSLLAAEDSQTIWINDVYGGGDFMHTFSLDKKEIHQLIEYLK